MTAILRLLIISVVLWGIPLWADAPTTVQGRADQINGDYLMIRAQRYEVIDSATEKGKADAETYGFETECWVMVAPKPYKIDYTTLINVGYADQVRLTLKNGRVRTIEILDMQQ